jgi:nicotinamide riboside transporter PnuC
MLKKYGNAIIWSLTGIIIILFWLSIRMEAHQIEFTLAAIAVWGISFLVNRKIRNEKNKEEE